MPSPTLTRRQLNRALLARQMLLERQTGDAPSAIARLIGLQAQVQNPPYIGLWTRLHGFQRAELTAALEARRVVRAALMRSTLHLFTAEDFLAFRATIQPALTKGLNSFHGRNIRGMDVERIVAAGRAALEREAQPFSALHPALLALEPERPKEALDYTVRTYLPLMQVYPGGVWKKGGSPAYALAEMHLGQAIDPAEAPGALFRRYLAAFGPASVADFQFWAGISKLKDVVEAQRGELRTFRDEDGRELFDLPDGLLPGEETPAPVRFVPEYDNLVIGHDDRRRILSEEDRTKVFLSAGRVRATILLDGFVAGVWKIEREKKAAALVIEPFRALASADREALTAEGERLLRWVEDDAVSFAIQFTG